MVVMDANEDSGDQKQNCTLNCLLCARKAVVMVYTTLLPLSKLKDDWILFYILFSTAVILGKKAAQNMQMLVYANFIELSYDHHMVHVSQRSNI